MNLCQALIIDEGGYEEAIRGEFEKECGKPATVKHGGCWFCEFHYELFFVNMEENELRGH